MPTQIKFGTSGWRAIVADEFTVANIRRAVTGIARYVASQKPQGAKVVVGRDPRFLGENFVALAAEILSAHGITPLVIGEAAPTPAIAYEVIRVHADGAINFTASHNPPEYNGIKFSTPDGAPALPEVTHKVEEFILESDGDSTSVRLGEGETGKIPPNGPGPGGEYRQGSGAAGNVPQPKPQSIEVREEYLKRLKELIDLPAIQKAGLKVCFDPLWGAARGYSDTLLRESGIQVATVHDYRDVLFGGHAPEPDDHLLDDLRGKMRETGAHIGIATDGDADRFGIVDQTGPSSQPNYIIALLFDYLVETRGWKNGVGQIGGHHQPDQRARRTSWGGTLRNAGGIQVYRRADQAGQDRHRRRRERRTFDPLSRAGEGWRSGRTAVLRDGGAPRQAFGRTIARHICQSWFLLPLARRTSA